MDSREIIAAFDMGISFPPGIHGDYFCFNFIGVSQMYQYDEAAHGWVPIRKKHKKENYNDLTILRQS